MLYRNIKLLLTFRIFFTKGRGDILLVFFKVVHLGKTLQLRLSTLKTCVNHSVVPDVLVRISVMIQQFNPQYLWIRSSICLVSNFIWISAKTF